MGKLSWTHHLKVSLGTDQVFTAKVQNPTLFTVYVYVKIAITPVDGGAPIIVFSLTTQLSPDELKQVSFTAPASLFIPGLKYYLADTIFYNLEPVIPVGTTPTSDVIGYAPGNSKSGAFATV